MLVVDDDELNLTTFRRAFRRDFEITCAGSGVEALGLVAGALFDVALVDFAMPGMNGVEFLRAARALRTDLPAVMVTAHADLAEVQAALSGGWVQAIVMKPFEFAGAPIQRSIARPRGLRARLRGEDDGALADQGPGGPARPRRTATRGLASLVDAQAGARVLGGAIVAWLLLSLVLFLVSAQIQSGRSPVGAGGADLRLRTC